jgi:cytochrome c-type biogenesis protein CcmE
VSTRNPARLIVALSVAAVLAVFLLYTAVAGNSTPTFTPSQLAGHGGKLSVVGAVIGPVSGDPHSAAGLRFGLKNIDGKSGVVPVVYHGDNPPPLFREGRHVVVSGTVVDGQVRGNDILTKCPSKYENAKKSTS